MDENDKARALEEQAARSRDLRELSYGRGHGDWHDPPAESADLTQDELGLLSSQVQGHHWNGWRRLTGDEDYYAACSCSWRSTDTGGVGPMLVQVKDHLNAIRQSRGWPPSHGHRHRTSPGPIPARVGPCTFASAPEGSAPPREASKCGVPVSESLTDLLSASAEQADRLVTELERGQSARTGASTPIAEIVQHKVERARELRKAIAAAAAALAVITEEIAAIHPAARP